MNDDLLESLLRDADPAADLMIPRCGDLPADVRRKHVIIQRRRRFVRQSVGAVVLYVAGLATMWCWTNGVSGSVSSNEPAAMIEPSAADRTPVVAIHEGADPEDGKTANDERAVVPAASPYQTLRLLGDKYLLQQGKVGLAVDVYARALEHASEAERQISYEHDSWLLISLKRDRLVSSL